MTTSSNGKSDDSFYDVAVVGAGMIGAAAGRHLAAAGHRVVLIGSPEADDRANSTGPFASHYDAGRITRIMDTDPVWAQLAAAAIARYGDLERRSGITFHHPAGVAWLLPTHRLEAAIADGLTRGADVRLVTREWLRHETGIVAPAIDGLSCAYEEAPAGHIHPPRFIEAELAVAGQLGATFIADAVDSMTWNERGASAGTATLTGLFGAVSARRVLLSTGMYGAQLAGIELALTRWARTTVRAEMRPTTAVPSLITSAVAEPDIDQIYWVPPVEFPDGRIMLKIGGVHEASRPLEGADDIARWFQGGGSSAEASSLKAVIAELLPDADVLSYEEVPCVVTETATGYPYVGWIDEHLAVAVGGNGSAAKSSDEIGRLAASLFDDDPQGDPTAPDLARFEPTLIAT